MNLWAGQRYNEVYREELAIERPIGAYVDDNGDRCAFYVAEDIIFKENYDRVPTLREDRVAWRSSMEGRLRNLGFDVDRDFQVMAVRDQTVDRGYKFMIMDTERWITHEEAEKYDDITG